MHKINRWYKHFQWFHWLQENLNSEFDLWQWWLLTLPSQYRAIITWSHANLKQRNVRPAEGNFFGFGKFDLGVNVVHSLWWRQIGWPVRCPDWWGRHPWCCPLRRWGASVWSGDPTDLHGHSPGPEGNDQCGAGSWAANGISCDRPLNVQMGSYYITVSLHKFILAAWYCSAHQVIVVEGHCINMSKMSSEILEINVHAVLKWCQYLPLFLNVLYTFSVVLECSRYILREG